MLRPTRQRPGGTLLIIAHSFLAHKSPFRRLGFQAILGGAQRLLLKVGSVTFESAIKEAVAFATSSAITHIPCAVYSRLPVTEKDSKRATVGSTESHQLYPTAVDSYGQTGYEPRFPAATVSLELSRKEGIMISKPTNPINAKLEEMYDSAMFWFYSSIQAIVFDANNFCYRISQLTQLTT